jgi:hypothetical protein
MSINNFENDKAPIRPDVVRVFMLKAITVQPAEYNPNDILFTDISTIDMKGNIPMTFMNMMISTVMSKVIG